jgi:Contractile injection system tube protein
MKFIIASIENPSLQVVADFAPKEISIDKSVPWNKHKNPKGDIPMLEFTNAENRNLSFELFFDATEASGAAASVVGDVTKLHEMTLIRKDAGSESEKHPPRVMVSVGPEEFFFKGVIESLSIKYTMFSPEGRPIRATCTLKIKEVDEVQAGGGGSGGGTGA